MIDYSIDGVFEAETEDDKAVVYEFRYRIYVEEMDRYGSVANHETRQLIVPVDAHSRHYLAIRDGEVVGTMRNTWGGDQTLPENVIEQYSLKPFLECTPERDIIVGERFMVKKEFRGTDVLSKLFETYLNFVNDNRIQLVFGDCEPHLLNLYLGMGFRTYSRSNFNSKDAGYLIPLVMVPEDLAYMRDLNSPLVGVLKDFGTDVRISEVTQRLLARGGAVISERMASRENYWSEVHQHVNDLEENRPNLFENLSEDSIQICLSKSTIIDCQEGDLVIKKGNAAQNLFFVLSGYLEVLDDDSIVNVLKTGDVFGEIAFLLGRPRTKDIRAATSDTRVVSMSETTIKRMIENDSETAAQLLLNISKMLCMRLITDVQDAGA